MKVGIGGVGKWGFGSCANKERMLALLCGSEAYVSVLAFYNYLQGAAKMNVTGAKTVLEDLSARFPGRPAKKVQVD